MVHVYVADGDSTKRSLAMPLQFLLEGSDRINLAFFRRPVPDAQQVWSSVCMDDDPNAFAGFGTLQQSDTFGDRGFREYCNSVTLASTVAISPRNKLIALETIIFDGSVEKCLI